MAYVEIDWLHDLKVIKFLSILIDLKEVIAENPIQMYP
jgi:hypothetical protein